MKINPLNFNSWKSSDDSEKFFNYLQDFMNFRLAEVVNNGIKMSEVELKCSLAAAGVIADIIGIQASNINDFYKQEENHNESTAEY